jgi:photosystem II stability/assembly factor-like uncharacterized protein
LPASENYKISFNDMKSQILIFSLLSILYTEEYRAQWITELVNPSNFSLEYVNIVDSSTAWSVGHYSGNQDSSILFIRTNKSPWFQHYLEIANYNDFTCIAALDSDRVWIGTANGKVYHSSYNNNKTVLQIDIGGAGYINDIEFSRSNKNYGYVFSDPPGGAGTPFKIFKTTNAGVNWIEFSPLFGGTYIGAFASMCVTDSVHVWLGLNCQQSFCQIPKVAYTTNGGINWHLASIPDGSNYVSAVIFKSDNLFGITAPWDQSPNKLYRSTNGGNSWSFLLNTQLQQPINSLCWANGTNNWYFCSNEEFDQIKKSTDDGVTWNPMFLSIGSDQVMAMDIMQQGNNVFGYAVTLNGRILRLVDSVSVIGIHNNNTQIPGDYLMEQNYPNPFNPSTLISFQIPQNGQVNINIYDLNGKLTEELVNRYFSAGKYSVEWNAENFPSGVYFCRINTGSFSDVIKMVLLK